MGSTCLPHPSSLQGQNLQMKAAAIKHISYSTSQISRTEKISKAGKIAAKGAGKGGHYLGCWQQHAAKGDVLHQAQKLFIIYDPTILCLMCSIQPFRCDVSLQCRLKTIYLFL